MIGQIASFLCTSPLSSLFHVSASSYLGGWDLFNNFLGASWQMAPLPLPDCAVTAAGTQGHFRAIRSPCTADHCISWKGLLGNKSLPPVWNEFLTGVTTKAPVPNTPWTAWLTVFWGQNLIQTETPSLQFLGVYPDFKICLFCSQFYCLLDHWVFLFLKKKGGIGLVGQWMYASLWFNHHQHRKAAGIEGWMRHIPCPPWPPDWFLGGGNWPRKEPPRSWVNFIPSVFSSGRTCLNSWIWCWITSLTWGFFFFPPGGRE